MQSYFYQKDFYHTTGSTMKKYLRLLLVFVTPSLFSAEVPMIYSLKLGSSETQEEALFVQHAKNSFAKALQHTSRLSNQDFMNTQAAADWRGSVIKNGRKSSLKDLTEFREYHLLNNLCSLPGSSHLHVGLLGGDSFVAALYGNELSLVQKVGLDWFKECTEELFYRNCYTFLPQDSFRIIKSACFSINKNIFTHPINIYFYDADHTEESNRKALTEYNDLFANVFIAVFDDWNWDFVRRGAFRGFDELGYTILYQNVLDGGKEPLRKLQYVAVIRKDRWR